MTDHFERALQERLLARSQVSPRDVDALRVFARSLPARRSLWQRPTFQFGLSAAAVVVAAVIVLPMLFRAPGFGGQPTPVPSLTPAPSAPQPTAGPSGPAPASPAAPTPDIAMGPIRLAVGSGSVVTVDIDDRDGLLVGAVAEQAEQAMSIRWFEAIVETGPYPGSIRVLWAGFPRDEEIRLQVMEDGSGGLVLHFVQEGPPLNSDAEGEDRILILQLATPVDPADVEVTFETP